MAQLCPFCASVRTRRSHRRLLDYLLSLTGRHPYRCAECHGRFFAARTPSAVSPPAWHAVREPSTAAVHAANAAAQAMSLASLNRVVRAAGEPVQPTPSAPERMNEPA